MCSGPYPDVHSQALSRWANTGAHTHCQHFAQVRWFLTRIEESLHSTTPKKGHTWLWNFKELSACFEPVLSIKTRWTHCMCAACGSSESSHLYEVFQSAYRQLHSTETALIRVQNDLLRAVDTHGGAILVLLDLSAAFDTIDHHRLLHTLESSFGIQGKALDWFHSYLTGRTQTVHIKKSTSEPHELQYGVPQGSVLGPILFTIYTTPLGELIRRHVWLFVYMQTIPNFT